ncbi:deoxyhypusine synthase isoform X2 [Lotus japonicus]|uniref:deoxyhypusine synthase isoform X2 n=1 Tax=Lotus japonicus TaxID=34305 RepID=UPI002585915E|nr:deoxyhypusine synthase isoform X2 [Lotus japonicus]
MVTMAETTKQDDDNTVMASVHATVFKESETLDGKFLQIEGYDFNQGVNYPQLLKSMVTTGFQASNLGDAIEVVNQMRAWRLADEPVSEDCTDDNEKDLDYRKSVTCKVFLGFTSNLISSGVRDTVRYLVQHYMVDVVVTTGGGIADDLIKCLAPTCKFEDWIIPIFDQMLIEQNSENVTWTPSKLIARLGKEIKNESSYLYWAYKNNIPVFCPGLTDGSLGDMLYFHSFRSPGLIVDIVQDIRAMNGEAVHANPRKTGMIILGGGLPKHHICNANMMRNGADYAVFINTAQEFDGSDSGARPDEAVSWGKIRGSAKTVKVHCDATIAFPLLVAETFASQETADDTPTELEEGDLSHEQETTDDTPTEKIVKAADTNKDSKLAPDSIAEEQSDKNNCYDTMYKADGTSTDDEKGETTKQDDNTVMASVHATVFKESETLEGKSVQIEGYDFNQGVNYRQLLNSMLTTGFQASNLGEAIQVVNQMLDWRLADEPISENCTDDDHEKDLDYRKSVTCKVFLGFTSNLISSGLRDTVRYLVQHHMVDAVVTTAGGIEEDLIKCLAPTFKGDFSLLGAILRSKGLNRIECDMDTLQVNSAIGKGDKK